MHNEFCQVLFSGVCQSKDPQAHPQANVVFPDSSSSFCKWKEKQQQTVCPEGIDTEAYT